MKNSPKSVSEQLQSLKNSINSNRIRDFNQKRSKVKHYQPYYNDPCISKMCTFGSKCVVKNVTSKRLDSKRLTAKSGILVNPKTEESSQVFDFLNKYAVCKCPPVLDCLEKIEDQPRKGVICGSDGVEYANKCQLERRQCLLQRRIWVSKVIK